MANDHMLERLQAVVNSKTELAYMSNKADIIDFYRDKYSTKGWTRAIAQDLHGMVKNRAGEDVSVKNIQRRFQGNRLAKEMSKHDKPLYEQLGKKLPDQGRKLKGDSITIEVKGHQSAGTNKGTRDRTIEVTFTGANAHNFINNPSFQDIWEEYGIDPDLFEDGEYELAIYAVS
jgi:hypothetical protein